MATPLSLAEINRRPASKGHWATAGRRDRSESPLERTGRDRSFPLPARCRLGSPPRWASPQRRADRNGVLFGPRSPKPRERARAIVQQWSALVLLQSQATGQVCAARVCQAAPIGGRVPGRAMNGPRAPRSLGFVFARPLGRTVFHFGKRIQI